MMRCIDTTCKHNRKDEDNGCKYLQDVRECEDHVLDGGEISSSSTFVIGSHSCSNCDNCGKDNESNMLYCEEHDRRLYDMFNPIYPTKYIGCNQWKSKE